MWPNSQFPVNMATLTEETFTGKFHFCGRVLNTPLAYTYIYIYNIYIYYVQLRKPYYLS